MSVPHFYRYEIYAAQHNEGEDASTKWSRRDVFRSESTLQLLLGAHLRVYCSPETASTLVSRRVSCFLSRVPASLHVHISFKEWRDQSSSQRLDLVFDPSRKTSE